MFDVPHKGKLQCMLYYADSLYTGSNLGVLRISYMQGPINIYTYYIFILYIYI